MEETPLFSFMSLLHPPPHALYLYMFTLRKKKEKEEEEKQKKQQNLLF